MNTREHEHEVSSSPTLKPGRRYLSVIAHVTGEGAALLSSWRREVLGTAESPLSTHVTVYLRELDAATEAALGELRAPGAAAALGLRAFEARWGRVCSFRPVTEVDYLDLDAGAGEFTAAHEAFVAHLGEGAAPFPYVPHVTLGHGLTAEQVANAHEVFDTLPAERRAFAVDALHLYSYDGSGWEPLGSIPLA